MFKKITLAETIRRDLANALHDAHEHSKAAEHHEALRVMFSNRAERLQERLDAAGNSGLKLPSYMLGTRPEVEQPAPQPRRTDAGGYHTLQTSAPDSTPKTVAEDFPAVGARP